MTSSTTIEPAYVVDTHALIWYLTTDKKLSKRAAAIFAAAVRGETRIYVSAVVIAEMYYANKKWRLFDDFVKTYTDLKAQPYIRFVPLVADEILDFDKDAPVLEMHDRIITGAARRLDVPLITSDPQIIDTKLVKIAW